MYLSPRTPHIPPKIGHKCPFWRVVQLRRRVPLVVTFAVFILPVATFAVIKVDGTPSMHNTDQLIFTTSTVFSICLFFIGIAMLLLSKEAKQEWKR